MLIIDYFRNACDLRYAKQMRRSWHRKPSIRGLSPWNLLVRKGYLEQNSMNLLPVNMANEVLNSSISISRLTSIQYQKSGYKFLQNWLIKTSASNVSLLYAPISWSTHAQQVLCKRTTAVVRPTELTSPITYTIFSDNFICLFRQLLPYSAIVSYACVHLLKLFMCRKKVLGMSVFHKNRLSHHVMTQP